MESQLITAILLIMGKSITTTEQRKVEFLQGISLNRLAIKNGRTTLSWLYRLGKEAHIVDDNEQLRTAYDQVDFIQKIRLDASQHQL